MLSFLELNFSRCPLKVKEQCYFTLVRPLLEYECIAWDPYFTGQIEQLEKVNCRAARFVTGNHFVNTETAKKKENLGWPPLSDRESRLKLSMFNKIRHDLICIPCEDMIPNPRKPGQYVYPSSKTNSHLGSFFPSTIRQWKSVPFELKSNPSFDSFKDSLVNLPFTP